MQIDFHYGTTYVIARLAGYPREDAHTIATAAQYIDDAVHDGPVRFENDALYDFESSAHKMLDYRNFSDLKNHLAWIPFHFLPGNEFDVESQVPEFIQRIVCKPNSEVAQAMLRAALQRKGNLHLLGVTAHVYVDTWAHQGFAGISHEVNEVVSIHDHQGDLDHEMEKRRKSFYKCQHYGKRAFSLAKALGLSKLVDRFKIAFVNDLGPLGHGPALAYPDLPYLKWCYKTKLGERIERDNTQIFMDACRHLFRFFLQARGEEARGMLATDEAAILTLLQFEDKDEFKRLAEWYAAIESGVFSFGSESSQYDVNEWIRDALNIDNEADVKKMKFPFEESFMSSDWKQMQDAIHLHRHTILHEILPQFKLCIA